MDDVEQVKKLRLHELVASLALCRDLIPKGARLLEVGAGSGWQAGLLAGRGFEVRAIDLESSIYAGEKLFPVVTYDGEHIPFEAGEFDVVFSSNVLEHIPHEREFQAELQRVLKPGGVAIHIVPSATWRFWTNLTHYPFILKIALRMIAGRGAKQSLGDVSVSARKYSAGELVVRSLFPARHGVWGLTSIDEMFWLSRRQWAGRFERAGWRVVGYAPNGLFYTAHSIFDSRISIPTRVKMSRWLGGSCHIFVLKKK